MKDREKREKKNKFTILISFESKKKSKLYNESTPNQFHMHDMNMNLKTEKEKNKGPDRENIEEETTMMKREVSVVLKEKKKNICYVILSP